MASSAALSRTLDRIVLQATGNLPLVSRVAVLVQTLEGVHLVAAAGKIVIGPFRVTRRLVTLPGSTETQVNVGGAKIVQITLPGSTEREVIAENLT